MKFISLLSTLKRNTKALNTFLAVLIICEVLLAGAISLSHNKDFMNTVALATSVRPETFTELYFENHTSLPSTVTQNQKITFTFTVHNLEYKTFPYPYSVYLNVNGHRKKIDDGEFSLPQNGYKTISETYTVEQKFSRAQVVVNLDNLNQDIFFWVQEKQTNEKIQ